MYITYDTQTNSGEINGTYITEKPNLSFEFAWFLVTDKTAQKLLSWQGENENLTDEERAEVVAYANTYTPPKPPEPTLDELKQSKLQEFKAQRDETTHKPLRGVDVKNLADLKNLEGSVEHFELLKNAEDKIVWTLADDTDKAFTKVELEELIRDYVIRKAQIFAHYQAKKAEIFGATDKAGLEAIGW